MTATPVMPRTTAPKQTDYTSSYTAPILPLENSLSDVALKERQQQQESLTNLAFICHILLREHCASSPEVVQASLEMFDKLKNGKPATDEICTVLNAIQSQRVSPQQEPDEVDLVLDEIIAELQADLSKSKNKPTKLETMIHIIKDKRAQFGENAIIAIYDFLPLFSNTADPEKSVRNAIAVLNTKLGKSTRHLKHVLSYQLK